MLIVVPLAAVLFQIYVPLFFGFLGFLEMPLLVVMYFALMRRSQIGGLLLGAVVGLAQDSLSKNPLGMFGIVNTLVGYFAASVGMRLDVEQGVIRLLLSFFFYLFHQMMYWVLERALLGQPQPFEIQRKLLMALLNAVVGVSLFHFLDKLRETAMNRARALAISCRPRQWIKNGLVYRSADFVGEFCFLTRDCAQYVGGRRVLPDFQRRVPAQRHRRPRGRSRAPGKKMRPIASGLLPFRWRGWREWCWPGRHCGRLPGWM